MCNRRIVIVEPDPILRKELMESLILDGYDNVTTVESMDQGVVFNPEIVLYDTDETNQKCSFETKDFLAKRPNVLLFWMGAKGKMTAGFDALLAGAKYFLDLSMVDHLADLKERLIWAREYLDSQDRLAVAINQYKDSSHERAGLSK